MTYIVSCMYIAHCTKRHFTSFSRSSQLHVVPSGSGADVHVLCMGKPSQSNPMFDIRVCVLYIHILFATCIKWFPTLMKQMTPILVNIPATWSLWDVVTCSGYIWKNSHRDLRQIIREDQGNYRKTATCFSSSGEICSNSARHATRCKMLTFLACLHVYGELMVVLCFVFVNVQQVFEDSEAPIDPSTSFLVWD